MSVGPTGGIAYSVAGSSLAQTTGPDAIRARQDALVQQRALEATQQTEDASGIGQTDGEDNQTNERDADGRTPWFLGRKGPLVPEDEAAPEATGEAAEEAPLAGAGDDANRDAGGHIDLVG